MTMFAEETEERIRLPRRIREDIDEMLAYGPNSFEVELPREWIDAMPENIKESPSSIVNYISCQLMWFVQRYLVVPGGVLDYSPWSVGGTLVHRILEVYYSEPVRKRTPQLLRDIRDVLWDAITSGNEEDGIVEPSTLREWDIMMGNRPADREQKWVKRTITEIMDISLENLEDLDGDPSKIDVVANEKWLRVYVNGIRINGKGDRVRRRRNGSVAIDDWKTGRSYIGEDEDPVVTNLSFLPAGMYAFMLHEMTKHDLLPADIKEVVLIYLKEGQEYSITINDEVLETVRVILERVTQSMKDQMIDGKVTVNPTGGKTVGYCKNCPLVALCPAWNESGTLDELRDEWGV